MSSLQTKGPYCFTEISCFWDVSINFKTNTAELHVLGRDKDTANIHTQSLTSEYHVFARWRPPKQAYDELMVPPLVEQLMLACLKILRKNMVLRACSAYKHLPNLEGFSSLSLLVQSALPKTTIKDFMLLLRLPRLLKIISTLKMCALAQADPRTSQNPQYSSSWLSEVSPSKYHDRGRANHDHFV